MTINFLDPHNWMLCISGLTPWPAQQQHQEDSSSKQQHQQVSSSNNNVSIKQSIAAYKMQALYKYIQQSSSSCSRPAATSTQWQANKHAASSTYSTHTQPARREDGGMARPDLAESLCKITKWGPLPVQVPIRPYICPKFSSMTSFWEFINSRVNLLFLWFFMLQILLGWHLKTQRHETWKIKPGGGRATMAQHHIGVKEI